jgi:hypothetical protein
MRCVMVLFSALLVAASVSFTATASASTAAATAKVAAPLRPGELGTENEVLRWMNGYRVRRDLVHVPEAIRSLSAMGAFKDPGASGVYVGFLAGIIGSNPNRANDLISKILSIPQEDQWVIVEAIAYSGLPDWKGTLQRFSARMPSRRAMIDKYLTGKLKTLDAMEFNKDPNVWERFTGFFDVRKHMPGAEPDRNYDTHDASTTVLDTFWGYYFATGDSKPILRIITVLPWSKDRNSVDKLTVGNSAKLTLATNAVRDSTLLAILRYEAKRQPKDTAVVLNEVVDAAETAQTERIRKDALADIDEIRRKGSLSRRETVWWGQAGQVVLAGACVVEAALGNFAFGLPCVIGGAVSAAGLQFYSSQQ